MAQEQKEYWLKKEAKEVASRLSGLHDKWNRASTHPVATSWYRNLLSYYAPVLEATSMESALMFTGEQGELVKMVVPQAKSLTEQLATITTKAKLAFKATAVAQGGDVIRASRLGDALSMHVVETQSLDTENYSLVEGGLILGAKFTYTRWRTDRGRFYSAEEDGRLLYDGDLDITLLNPWEVIYDTSVAKWEDLNWVEVREKINRYDLIAQFPDLEAEILNLPPAKVTSGMFSDLGNDVSHSDDVYVYSLYHKSTPALPMGRMMFYSSPDTVYYDGANEYETIPVEPFMPKRMQGLLVGYPFLSDLLPSQQMLDHSFSAIATNQAANAVQNVLIPNGSNINIMDINGMNWVNYTPQNVPGGGKPEALQLTQSAPETFKFIDVIVKHMEQISQISAALRGDPPPGVTSGVAIATLHASALEFVTSVFKAYKSCMENTMMHAVNAYRKFCKIEKIVALTGQKNQTLNKKFVGTDLDPINKIRLPLANPLMQTIGGRLDVAEKLLQAGLITATGDYVAIIEGAPIQQIYENELSESDRIQEENEMLAMGEEPLILMTDDHPMHIRKHKKLLEDRANREEGQFTQQILNHIMQHYELYKNQDPLFAAILKTGQPMPVNAPQAQGGQPLSASPAVQPVAEVNKVPNATEGPARAAEDLLNRGK